MLSALLIKTLLVILPIAFVFVLLIVLKVPTHISAVAGLVVTGAFAMLFFDTPMEVNLRAGVQGIFVSFPISLMTLFSILQICIMGSSGALARISVFIKTLSPNNREAQIMITNLGAGTTLVSVGATPVSVLPPIMRGLGYDNRLSIALPAVGFDALCTYSMMAAPMVTYCDLTGVSLVEAAKVFSMYLPAVSTLIAFAMFYLVGGFAMIRKGIVPAILTGITAGGTAFAIAHIPAFNSAIILTGVIAGIMAIVVMFLYLKASGSKIIDRSVLTEEDLEIEESMPLATALSPWIILICSLLVVAFVPAVDELFRVKLAFPVSFIPGYVTNTRPFWNAYFWIIVSTALSLLVLRPDSSKLKESFAKWIKRAPKPVISTILFFMMGYVINYTGFQVLPDGTWAVLDDMNNMVTVLATASSNAFGALYPLIAAPLGLLGGFITSSEASALAMFAKYNILTAENLGLNALVITAATGIGAGLSSVISPAKLQNAAATIDAIGEENDVLRDSFKISIVLIVAVSIMCWIFCLL